MPVLLSASTFSSRGVQSVSTALVLVALLIFFFSSSTTETARARLSDNLPFRSYGDKSSKLPPPPNLPPHPIDHLVHDAERDFHLLLAKETETLSHAAQSYRDRRGRQPPPGFDVWYEFACNHSAFMIEEFWDRIYHDLNPFWGVPALQMRERAHSFEHRISIRNHNVTWRSDGQDRPWMGLWSNLTATVAPWLPDMDLPINVLDETRLFVPWDKINEYMAKERASRRIVPEAQLKDTFHGLADLDARQPPRGFDPQWSTTGSMWEKVAPACPPGSPGRTAEPEIDFSTPPNLTSTFPVGSYHGYVANATFAASPCDLPALRGLHGSFIEPISISTSTELFPIFGGSKLPMNNEILLPAAMYWTDDPFYSGGDRHGIPWESKRPAMIWRGAGTGGRNRKENWTRFQRHRFVSMVNTTSVGAAEDDPNLRGENFVLPQRSLYDVAVYTVSSTVGDLARWVRSWSDVAMYDLLCFPQPESKSKAECSYCDHYFSIRPSKPMRAQYDFKYLPDIDGNSFSGRYRGFLGSTSAPIKATIYQEWHDSRLVPWKHYIPMDNTFIDIYGIMQYFIGNKAAGIEAHDRIGEGIAVDGKDWTERVLRREDMQIYVFRLLLEYARLCDDNREVLGWKEHSG